MSDDAAPFRINNKVGDVVCGYSLIMLPLTERVRLRSAWRKVIDHDVRNRDALYCFAISYPDHDHDYHQSARIEQVPT